MRLCLIALSANLTAMLIKKASGFLDQTEDSFMPSVQSVEKYMMWQAIIVLLVVAKWTEPILTSI